MDIPAYSARGPSNRSVLMKQSQGPWNFGGVPAGPQPGPSAWRRTYERKGVCHKTPRLRCEMWCLSAT